MACVRERPNHQELRAQLHPRLEGTQPLPRTLVVEEVQMEVRLSGHGPPPWTTSLRAWKPIRQRSQETSCLGQWMWTPLRPRRCNRQCAQRRNFGPVHACGRPLSKWMLRDGVAELERHLQGPAGV